jgi:hypothetical protein
MTLRPYSANPRRLTLQIVADVFVLLWIYVWARVGIALHDAILSAASVGYRVQTSAGNVAANLDQAGHNVGNTPLIGDALRAPLESAAAQVASLAGSGRDLGDRLAGVSTAAGWLVALAPIVVLLAIWLPARWRFARRAGATLELAQAYAGQELLALRALVNRPLQELQRVAPDPLLALRTGDPDAVQAFARLEMAAAGVNPPAGARARALGQVGGPPPL